MAIDTGCYMVKINTFPFKPGEEEPVGCYTTLKTAQEVGTFITDVFGQQVSGGIETSINNIPDSEAIYKKLSVIKSLTDGERKRLNESLCRIIKLELLSPGSDILDDISD